MSKQASLAIHDTSHITYESLLEGNEKFIEEALSEDPQFFQKLANGQKPPVLWIGCADSRVPADRITRTNPGEIFVHRNIANVVVHTDLNLLSVLDYAVNVLKVKHVIVVGHYGCGGVQAAMGNKQFGLIDNWLRNIKDVYSKHAEELKSITDEKQKFDRMVELNVIEGVNNLCKTTIVQGAWAEGQELQVHGWVYALDSGKITDLKVDAADPSRMDSVYKFE
ncbi:carbonate dehydratase [Mucilaginibacter daejeonensis]|uniref:carbonate dehydratase n=1 Tax=Mucilaginibacter daejeonensis TaxID=398049 RepID=UPI001D17762D|nr:carbonate dehydratase [Mucilaginibacter daejeonensis]UEG54292.1 carbonate dehydratase [Mucilaginibacter daejeonensis]